MNKYNEAITLTNAWFPSSKNNKKIDKTNTIKKIRLRYSRWFLIFNPRKIAKKVNIQGI